VFLASCHIVLVVCFLAPCHSVLVVFFFSACLSALVFFVSLLPVTLPRCCVPGHPATSLGGVFLAFRLPVLVVCFLAFRHQSEWWVSLEGSG
jgi:hypothetical protein